jgi:zinc D-Ala-D-Ala carboxypeptidase
MKLSTHFTLEEFTKSANAARRGIDNSVPPELMTNAMATAEMMERIRDVLGDKPIIVTSGYRCKAVNALAGSSDSSDHVKAMAVDFECPAFGTPYEVAKHLATKVDSLGIGQLIHEFGSWVHVSTRTPDKIINRIITISSNGTQPGVVRV